jgi:hypothetical protein
VKHVGGKLAALEDEMCDFAEGGLSTGASPDRLDALVYAVTELTDKPKAEPRIRSPDPHPCRRSRRSCGCGRSGMVGEGRARLRRDRCSAFTRNLLPNLADIEILRIVQRRDGSASFKRCLGADTRH